MRNMAKSSALAQIQCPLAILRSSQTFTPRGQVSPRYVVKKAPVLLRKSEQKEKKKRSKADFEYFSRISTQHCNHTPPRVGRCKLFSIQRAMRSINNSKAPSRPCSHSQMYRPSKVALTRSSNVCRDSSTLNLSTMPRFSILETGCSSLPLM